jgi:hypothetical protein
METKEELTPKEEVTQSVKFSLLLSLIIIRGSNDPSLTQEEKAKDLEVQVDRLVKATMDAIETKGVTFVKREDVPAAFGNA